MLTKENLHMLYVKKGLSDREIAKKFNVDRTTVIYNRNKYGIKTREFLHDVAVNGVFEKLMNDGYLVRDMKKRDKTFSYDLLVGEQRVKVLSSNLTKDGRFMYCFTTKEENKNVESEFRLKLPNGRYKILLPKVCDVLVCVGIEGDLMHYWIIPVSDVGMDVQSISTRVNANNKYYEYYDNWEEFNFSDGLLNCS